MLEGIIQKSKSINIFKKILGISINASIYNIEKEEKG